MHISALDGHGDLNSISSLYYLLTIRSHFTIIIIINKVYSSPKALSISKNTGTRSA